MTQQAHLALLHGCHLPQAWGGKSVWRILETRFDATRFLGTWQVWLADAQRPRLLHYVALTPRPPDAAALLQAAQSLPELKPLAAELAGQWRGLMPGFHRLVLAQGQLHLTLCVGELQPLLREQQFEADTVFFDTAAPWDRWAGKALARCCRRATAVAGNRLGPAQIGLLQQIGFDMQDDSGTYEPRWELKTVRQPLRTRGATPGNCAVIGAGLAGASVAAALARRGWQVQVLDAAPAPAAAASGLPAGLVVPHVSADDSPRSRLSRAGVRLMLQEAGALLHDPKDWAPSGVLELRIDGSPGLPANWPAEGYDISRPAVLDPGPAVLDPGPAWRAGMAAVPALWHAQAGWIKPASLVRAWLAQAGVQFRGNADVAALRREGSQWLLLDAAGQTLTAARHVVLANAGEATRLIAPLQDTLPQLAQLPPMHGMRGVLSWGLHPNGPSAALPPFPVNGMGSLIPAVPTEAGAAWYAGATYEAADATPAPLTTHHEVNRDKLRTLLPAAAGTLGPAFESGAVQAWTSTRCVSADRLPLVGPLDAGAQPTLWISAAMGSRGLSFAMLCAELLAARLGAEPWPVPASLARLLHARRRPVEHGEDF